MCERAARNRNWISWREERQLLYVGGVRDGDGDGWLAVSQNVVYIRSRVKLVPATYGRRKPLPGKWAIMS